jgi:hypothetical protein
MSYTKTGLILLVSALALTACRTPTPVRNALEQEAKGLSKPYKVGGAWDRDNNQLTLTVNGEPALRGGFPPYTPTLNLNGDYRGAATNAECYFASILSARRGLVGIVGGAVQSGQGKTSDTCKVFIEGKEAATLNF